jgi:hypothetical protein
MLRRTSLCPIEEGEIYQGTTIINKTIAQHLHRFANLPQADLTILLDMDSAEARNRCQRRIAKANKSLLNAASRLISEYPISGNSTDRWDVVDLRNTEGGSVVQVDMLGSSAVLIKDHSVAVGDWLEIEGSLRVSNWVNKMGEGKKSIGVSVQRVKCLHMGKSDVSF